MNNGSLHEAAGGMKPGAGDTGLIFVYGTLRQAGVRPLPGMFPAAVFLAHATVHGQLYDLGAYPGLLLDEAGPPVTGEVYRVTGEMIEALDRIEKFEPDDPAASLFLRGRTRARLADGTPAACWVYTCNPGHYRLDAPIPSGDWIRHAGARRVWPEDIWPGEKPDS